MKVRVAAWDAEFHGCEQSTALTRNGHAAPSDAAAES